MPFYYVGAQIHLALKVSKDRGSRHEDVEMGRGMYEAEQLWDTGYRVITEELEARQPARKRKWWSRAERMD